MLEDWFNTVGIRTLYQWDVLVFLHRHRTALLNAESIARLMRYKSAPVVAALDYLEKIGLVERSRLSQGARLYKLGRLEGPRGQAFEKLVELSETRSGRLKLSEALSDSRSVTTISVKAVVVNNPPGEGKTRSIARRA